MKTFNFLRKAIPFFILLSIVVAGNSQNAPIGCNGQFFVTHGSNNSSTSTTSVKKLSFSGSTITPNVFNIDPASVGFNAIGINPVDGYLYGLRYPTTNNRVRLVRVGDGTPGNIVDLGEVTSGGGNLADEDLVYSGCFDNNGVFYFISVQNELFKITGNNYPTASLTTTFIGNAPGGGTGTNFFVDIAIDPVTGTMYGVTYNRRLLTINTTTGATTFIGTHTGSDYIASLFFDEVGNLFGYRADGNFFLINKTNAGLTAAGSGPSYTYADGCSCSVGRVFHDLDFTANPGNQLCPTAITPNPIFPLVVSVSNQSSTQQTGLTYTLDISDPKKRFKFTESAATIKANLMAAGVATAGSIVTLTAESPATGTDYNKVVVTGFQTGAPASTQSFTLQAQLISLGGPYDAIPLQSVISGLPAIIGSTDLSNDPSTPAPDDPTVISFCPNITLPVSLISFSGTYKNNNTLLNWTAENQVNLAYFDIERSSNGTDFTSLATEAQQASGNERIQYQYADNLSFATDNIFYYRLKMVDMDASYKYSNVILIRKTDKLSGDISIIPNPIVNSDQVTARISATANGLIELSIVDMSGRVVLRQQNQVNEGINSIAISNLEKLQAGIYLLQMRNGIETSTVKFVITQTR